MSKNEKLQNRCLGIIMAAVFVLATEANPKYAAKLIELMKPLLEELEEAEQANEEEPK